MLKKTIIPVVALFSAILVVSVAATQRVPHFNTCTEVFADSGVAVFSCLNVGAEEAVNSIEAWGWSFHPNSLTEGQEITGEYYIIRFYKKSLRVHISEDRSY